MGAITLEDFSQSVAYREIDGLGEERGREQGLRQGFEPKPCSTSRGQTT